MFSIHSLTKEYKIRHGVVNALNGVSFDLPDKGLIFIVGKSGSGKSTLLNILGGLDKNTSGDIVFMNQKFTKFTKKDFDAYRNNDVGFVFQNNYLIDRYTIYDNLKLTLDLVGKKDDGTIDSVLSSLNILDLKDRKPSELSAGQLQRATIARAIVKKPRLILADEPTGNLDSKTAKVILEVFHQMASKCLVVVVSHTMQDAKDYGDRIIELADGIIVSDEEKIRNETDELTIDENTAYIPYSRPMNFYETNKLMMAAKEKEGHLFLERRESNYSQSTYRHQESPLFSNNKALSVPTLLKYSVKNVSILSSLITIILVTILTTLIAVSESYISYDGSDAINEIENESLTNSVTLTQVEVNAETGELMKSDFSPISEEQIAEIENLSNDKVYQTLSFSVPIRAEWTTYQLYNFNYSNFSNGYPAFTNGLVLADDSLLKERFADKTGDVPFVLSSATSSACGVFITDYLADAFIYSKYKSSKKIITCYADLVSSDPIYRNVNIDGIINTNYRNNPKFIQMFRAMQMAQINNKNFDVSPYASVIDEVMNVYCCLYTVNPNFVDSFIAVNSDSKNVKDPFFPIYRSTFSSESYTINYSLINRLYTNKSVSAGSIWMSYDTYNSFFGTEYTAKDHEGFVPNETNIHVTLYSTAKKAWFDGDLKVEKLFTGYSEISFLLSLDQMFASGISNYMCVYSLVIDHPKDLKLLHKYLNGSPFYERNVKIETVDRIREFVHIFTPLFILMLSVLFLLMVMVQSTSSLQAIAMRKKDIGVMRSMGASVKDLAVIYAFSMIEIGIITVIISSIFSYLGVQFGDHIMRVSFASQNNAPLMKEVKILLFSLKYMMINILVILSSTILSAVLPFAAIERIDPIKIIRGND